MKDTELEESIIHHAKEAISHSEGDALKKYVSPIIMSVEIARKTSIQGKYLAEFLKEVDTINTHQDSLLLVCLGMVYAAANSSEKPSSLLPELSENTLGFVLSQYHPIKRLVNAGRAAELFSNEP